MCSRRLLLRRALGQAGYTLMETLVVMSLLLIVIGALADGFTSATKTETDQTARADDQEAARQALDRLRKDIHCASAASVTPTVTPNGPGETLNLTVNPGYCVAVTAGGQAGVNLSDGVQWCTVPLDNSGTRYALYRTIVHACDAADAVFQVDHITQGNVWASTCGPNDSHLQAITVDLPVNRDVVTRPGRTYELKDSISLRNDTATSGTLCQSQSS